jgi:hypothetical protein
MRPLSPEAQSLLDAARDADLPPPAAKSAIQSALHTKIGAAAAATAATAAAATAGSASAATAGAGTVATAAVGGGLITAKLAIVAIVAAATGTVVTLQVTHPPEQPIQQVQTAPAVLSLSQPLPSVAPAPIPVPPPVAEPAPAIEPEPAKEIRRPVVGTRPAPLPTSRETAPPAEPDPIPLPAPPLLEPAQVARCDFSQELKLLYLARAELQQHHAESTLKLVAQSRAECPNSQLAQETEALRILAICELGRLAEGREAATAFLAANPRSPSAKSIRATCGVE